MKKVYMKCKDYLVSGEEFDLIKQKNDLLITLPILESLDKYYESEKYVSHTNSKKTIIDKVYQIIKKYNLYKKEKFLYNLLGKRKSVLDVGCGTGDFINKCKKESWDILGMEPSKVAYSNTDKSIKKHILKPF